MPLTPDETELSGPIQNLVSALRKIHVQAGKPSMRAIASDLGNISHTTVAEAFKGKRVPSWQVVRNLVAYLGGDERLFQELWAAAVAPQENADAGLPAMGDFLARYRRQAAEYHSKLELPDFARRRRVPFEALYVPPRIMAELADIGEFDTQQFEDRINHTVLLGDPGSGKTTACHALMYRYAVEQNRSTPFLVTLRDFAAKIPPTQSVLGYIESRLEVFYQCPPPPGLINQLLIDGEALVIFDGLDEVLDNAYRSEVTSIIELFCAEFPATRVLVTSRVIGYDEARLDPQLFTAYSLSGFDQEWVGDYVRRWFAQEDDISSAEVALLTKAFMEESVYLSDMRSNPLMLALMCILYRGEGSIPHNRAELYQQITLLFFNKWDARRNIHPQLRSRQFFESILRHLAFWILSRSDSEYTVRESELIAKIEEFLHTRQFNEAAELAQEFINFYRGRAEILRQIGMTKNGETLYAFTHSTFLEYFAAAHLASSIDSAEELARIIEPHIAQQEWVTASQLALQIRDRTVENGAESVIAILLNRCDDLAPKERNNVLTFLFGCIKFLTLSPSLIQYLTGRLPSS